MVEFCKNRTESDLILKIVNRAWEDHSFRTSCKNKLQVIMDVEACHCNGNPLDLLALLTAKDTDFFHDMYGIKNHIDRSTGKLENCFSPRHSFRETKEVTNA